MKKIMNDLTSLRERIVKTLNYLPQGIATEALADKLEAIVAQEVVRAREETAHMYTKELEMWKRTAEGFLKREQLKMPEKMYICDNPVCSSLHTEAELKALTRTPPKEGK